jgi:hypothetical protein
MAVSAHGDWLDQFEEGKPAGGRAGELEAIPQPAAPLMTSRRFPPPWHADTMPGGYVVRDANGQALAYLYSRESDAEARQAKVLTKDERDASPSTSQGCPSCCIGRTTTE